LGAEGRGEISFFVTTMVLILLFTGLLGGASLVYLTPRHNFFKFLIPTYTWTLVLTMGFCFFFFQTGQLESRDFYFLFFSTLFNSWKSNNMMILLGKEKMSAFNWLSLIHSVFLILFFILFYYPVRLIGVESFYWGIILSNALIWLWSFWLLFDLGEKFTVAIDRSLMKQLITFGGLAQLANIIQFANYRISYYYLMNMQERDGTAELGKYSIAVSIAESVWIIGQSLATVQFSRLSNEEDATLRRKITLRLFKFNFLLNLLAVVMLLLVPAWVYADIFGGEEFGMVSTYILWLAVGIFMLGASTSFAAYFASKGKYLPAVVSAVLGVIATLVSCEFFIKDWGVLAAATGASLSYTIVGLYFFFRFLKEEKLSFLYALPDIHELKVYYRWTREGLYKWKRR